MLQLFFLFLAGAPQAASSTSIHPYECDYDDRLLDLGFEQFDQDQRGGWRALRAKTGCEEKAADLLKFYRQKYTSIIPLLYWHEAQIRASIGDNEKAIPLMEGSLVPADKDVYGWNPYVNATIAFLRRDRIGFLNARERLEHVLRPKDWPAGAEWPQNASVIAALWNCFEKPYKLAYSVSCRPASKRPL